MNRKRIATNAVSAGILATALAATGCSAEGTEGALDSIPLATLNVDNGSVLHFFAAPEVGDVGCSEDVPADGETLPVIDPETHESCLEIYLMLTPADTPVPQMLYSVEATDDERLQRLAADRELVGSDYGVIEMELGTPELVQGSGSRGTSAHSCSGGSSHWAAVHCDYSGGSSVINYCDSGQWFSLYRSSGSSKRKHSFSETLACGTYGDVKHQYKWGSGYKTAYSSTNIPDNYYNWTRWKGTIKRKRRVHHYRVWASGYVRAHTMFYN